MFNLLFFLYTIYLLYFTLYQTITPVYFFLKYMYINDNKHEVTREIMNENLKEKKKINLKQMK